MAEKPVTPPKKKKAPMPVLTIIDWAKRVMAPIESGTKSGYLAQQAMMDKDGNPIEAMAPKTGDTRTTAEKRKAAQKKGK